LDETLNLTAGFLVHNVFTNAYKLLDAEYYARNDNIAKSSGAVAVTILIIGTTLFCINLGDSRAVLSRSGKAINLSVDHKATCEKEKKRVQSAGGYIFGGRLLGKLAITRAFGDFSMKIQHDEFGAKFQKKFLLVEPEVRQIEIDPETDDFVLIASDGIFDKMSSQDCVDRIHAERSK
jgi:serine/threonine protein phosphatase PrpC